MNLSLRHTGTLFALVLAGLLGPTAAWAGVSGIRDGAGFFSSGAKEKAERSIAEMERATKKELLIETFAKVPDELRKGVDASDKAAVRRVVEKWSIDRARENKVNGVYVLLTREPAHLEVTVGNQTLKKAFTGADRDVLADTMLRSLRAKRFDDALLEGVGFVSKTVQTRVVARPSGESSGGTPAKSTAASAPASVAATPAAPVPSPVGSGIGIGRILLIGAILLFGFFLVTRLLGALFGGGRSNVGPGGMAGAGMGGGGFFRSLLGGIFGAAAGMWLYDMFTGHGNAWGGQPPMDSGTGGSGDAGSSGADTDYSSSGGDFGGGSGDGGFGGFGGDSGGGGDFGGGSSGGDF